MFYVFILDVAFVSFSYVVRSGIVGFAISNVAGVDLVLGHCIDLVSNDLCFSFVK